MGIPRLLSIYLPFLLQDFRSYAALYNNDDVWLTERIVTTLAFMCWLYTQCLRDIFTQAKMDD
jgi:hypothetical protein